MLRLSLCTRAEVSAAFLSSLSPTDLDKDATPGRHAESEPRSGADESRGRGDIVLNATRIPAEPNCEYVV